MGGEAGSEVDKKVEQGTSISEKFSKGYGLVSKVLGLGGAPGAEPGKVGESFGKAGAGMGVAAGIGNTVKGISELFHGKKADGAIDIATGVGGVMKDGGELLGKTGLGGVGSVVSDLAGIGKGAKEVADGKTKEGVYDIAQGGVGAVGDVAKMMGKGGAAGPVAAIAGGLEMGKGIGEIATDKGYGGKTMDGIHDLLTGASTGAGAFGGQAAALGKAFGVGMKVGDMAAPYVFGDMNEKGSHTEQIKKDANGKEEEFHASTGNRAIDWVFGVGNATNGRFK